MRYIVDGYNLLFKEAWTRSASSLELARKQLIEELDTLASTLNLNITVVFDAPFQSDDLKRGHFRSLEIVFTAKNQTADDYIVDLVDMIGKKAIVVTSDRGLSTRTRGSGATVEAAHDFLVHLRKKCRNRLAKSYSAPLSIKKPKAPVQPKEETIVVLAEAKPLDMKNLPSLADIPAWDKIFTSRFKEKK
jgi:uncharacterized protein